MRRGITRMRIAARTAHALRRGTPDLRVWDDDDPPVATGDVEPLSRHITRLLVLHEPVEGRAVVGQLTFPVRALGHAECSLYAGHRGQHRRPRRDDHRRPERRTIAVTHALV